MQSAPLAKLAVTGFDRNTGALLTGWPEVVQSLGVIFSTGIGQRIMRRHFGSRVPGLLGENLTPATVLRFVSAVTIAVDLWEPRYRVIKVDVPEQGNSPEKLRTGALALTIRGEYRPRALQGDLTPAQGEYLLTVGLGAGGAVVLTP